MKRVIQRSLGVFLVGSLASFCVLDLIDQVRLDSSLLSLAIGRGTAPSNHEEGSSLLVQQVQGRWDGSFKISRTGPISEPTVKRLELSKIRSEMPSSQRCRSLFGTDRRLSVRWFIPMDGSCPNPVKCQKSSMSNCGIRPKRSAKCERDSMTWTWF